MSWRARSNSAFEAFRTELARDWPESARLVVVSSVDSTNALARRTMSTRPPTGPVPTTVFAAWSQEAGRGRQGRSWRSPPGGGAYVSVLAPVEGREALEALPLLLPVALCRALESLGLRGCRVKWPNDLMVDGRKLGGMLIESVTFRNSVRAAILGFGINYEAPPGRSAEAGADGPDRPAVGLADLLDLAPGLAAVARVLCDEVLAALGKHARNTSTPWVDAYRELTAHRPGEPIVWRGGSERLEGHFAGFDSRGFLRLTVATGERTIATGDIVEPSDE